MRKWESIFTVAVLFAWWGFYRLSLYRVTEVVDGDTLKVATWWHQRLFGVAEGREITVRLSRIDAPELNTRRGKWVARALKKRIEGRLVRLAIKGREKYGRVLAEVYFWEVNISSVLLGSMLAIPFNGKR